MVPNHQARYFMLFQILKILTPERNYSETYPWRISSIGHPSLAAKSLLPLEKKTGAIKKNMWNLDECGRFELSLWYFISGSPIL